MLTLPSGQRSCLVEVWAPSVTNDGEPDPPLVKLKDLWVSLIPVRSREEMDYYGERMAVVVYRARADWFDAEDVTESMVFKYNGATFGINAIRKDYVTTADIEFDLREQRLGA